MNTPDERLDHLIAEAGRDSHSSAIYRLCLAHEFARKVHEGQLRKDGSPYFAHVLRVGLRASILCEQHRLGSPSLAMCIGLLHDTVEDTPTTPEQIRELFGRDVAVRVAVLTNDKSLKRAERIERYCLQLRSSIDPIVGIVKLADMEDNAASVHPEPGWMARWAIKALKQLDAISYNVDDLEEYSALKVRLEAMRGPVEMHGAG